MARTAFADRQRPELAVKLVLVALVGFRLAEVRQHLVIAPSFCAVGGPAVIVGAMATNVNHRVERTGAAKSFSPRQVDEPVIEARLRLARIIPIVLRFPELPSAAGT